MINSAFVHIWNKRIGAVAWNPETRLAAFQFENSHLSSNLNLAPIMMPLSEGNRIYEFPETKDTATFKGLPGLVADVLPDKYGNALINTWLAQQGRATNSLNPVEILCFIGKRGMGALEFEPIQPKSMNTNAKFEIQNLIDVAEKILSGRKDFTANLSDDEEKALFEILKIGSSVGGARAKVLVAYNPKTKEIRSGQANVPNGFEHWLIKFDGVTDSQFGASKGYGKVEMAYYNMATSAGINMMESKLLHENGRAHFMTKRFDRLANNEKIHVQTFCAMRHFDFNEVHLYSYEELFETMRMLGLSYPEAQEMYRRMVFNVLARNCDDHTKNFAFTMNQQGQWNLAPAYDICHAYRPGSQWVSQHALSLNEKRKDHSKNDFLEIGKKMNIKNADEIIAEVSLACSQWLKFADEVEVDTQLRDAIKTTHLTL